MEQAASPSPARFSDRLNAFALDASLFSAGYFISAMAVTAARGGHSPDEFYGVWILMWAGVFVLYHAYLTSEGRRTLGKRVFGLEVLDAGGEPPGFGTALLRAASYALSSLFLAVGFLWALRGGRAWHDLIAGTRVVEAEPRGRGFRLASAVGAWGVGLALVAGWFLLVVVAPGMARMKLLANGRTGVKALASLEEEYRKSSGRYTDDLALLLTGTPDGPTVAAGLPLALREDGIHIVSDGASYAIEAEALDDERTILRVENR